MITGQVWALDSDCSVQWYPERFEGQGVLGAKQSFPEFRCSIDPNRRAACASCRLQLKVDVPRDSGTESFEFEILCAIIGHSNYSICIRLTLLVAIRIVVSAAATREQQASSMWPSRYGKALG